MKTNAKTFLCSVCVLMTSVIPVVAHGWADLGHQIVGNIAEERIAPQTKDFVRGILGIEPMAVAANWPDHVRSDSRFGGPDSDFSPYHFSEVPTGFTFDTRPNKEMKDAYSVIVGAVQLLTKKHVPREKRMIALRYLIHVVGDIHQPLHVGNGFDRGGNSCTVRYGANGKFGNFHSFWDDNMVVNLGLTYVDKSDPKSKAPAFYPDYVKAIKKAAPDLFSASKPTFTSANVGTQVKTWIDASGQLRETIYPDKLNGDPQAYKLRKYCLWYQDQNKGILGDTSIKSVFDIQEADIKTLDQDYVNQFVKKIVEVQLINGGVRLAGLLDYIADAAKKNDRKVEMISDDLQNKILKEIQDEFTNH